MILIYRIITAIVWKETEKLTNPVRRKPTENLNGLLIMLINTDLSGDTRLMGLMQRKTGIRRVRYTKDGTGDL